MTTSIRLKEKSHSSPLVELPFPNGKHLAITRFMNEQCKILHELSTSIADALRRAEDRMSHVQRQLAGWPAAVPSMTKLSDDSTGWQQLEVQTTQLTEGVDQDLAAVQSSLAELVQQGRQLKK